MKALKSFSYTSISSCNAFQSKSIQRPAFCPLLATDDDEDIDPLESEGWEPDAEDLMSEDMDELEDLDDELDLDDVESSVTGATEDEYDEDDIDYDDDEDIEEDDADQNAITQFESVSHVGSILARNVLEGENGRREHLRNRRGRRVGEGEECNIQSS